LELRKEKEEDGGEHCITRSFIICVLHKNYWGDQIKEDEMGGAFGTLW
jgi:hypothetical protein